jgi:hypothetical protein
MLLLDAASTVPDLAPALKKKTDFRPGREKSGAGRGQPRPANPA